MIHTKSTSNPRTLCDELTTLLDTTSSLLRQTEYSWGRPLSEGSTE